MKPKKYISITFGCLFAFWLFIQVGLKAVEEGEIGVFFVVLISAAVWGVIVYAIVSRLYSAVHESKFADIIRQKQVEEQQKQELLRISNTNTEKHQVARNTFKYLSDTKLTSIYEDYLDKEEENMERLALEEILVERGIIENSPMHEKLFLMKNKH